MVGEVTSVVAVGGLEEREMVMSEAARAKVDSRERPSPPTDELDVEVIPESCGELGVEVVVEREAVERVLLAGKVEEVRADSVLVASKEVERGVEREVEEAEDEKLGERLGETGAVVEEKKGLSSSRLEETVAVARMLELF